MAGRKKRWSLTKWLNSIPHLFGKSVVTVCVACGMYFSERALSIQERTGHDTSTSLIAILGLFGGELLFLCLRDVLASKKGKEHGDV